ncbi:hypothetical protein SDC9_106304 [bioreactor metagenome]|uniref:Uncharacterized protein n=1 Tax=bioreactor metagenome TaxID=1076179 RepID=A0A645B1Y0_9ZZZZ
MGIFHHGAGLFHILLVRQRGIIHHHAVPARVYAAFRKRFVAAVIKMQGNAHGSAFAGGVDHVQHPLHAVGRDGARRRLNDDVPPGALGGMHDRDGR